MKTALLASLGRYRDFGLLILRLGVGVLFVLHGYPKLIGGPERWAALGGAMGYLGITVLPVAWGLAAACAELFGGLLLILGLLFRPACLALLATMAVAATMHFSRGDGLSGASHALELACVFFGLLFVGPGRHSLDGQ
jgi:putative oxidoreductase